MSAAHAVDVEVRLYDRLFRDEQPDAAGDYQQGLNPDSLEVIAGAKAEPSLAEAAVGAGFQFERLGYFCVDKDTAPGRLVFNRTIGLRDTWAKIEQGRKS